MSDYSQQMKRKVDPSTHYHVVVFETGDSKSYRYLTASKMKGVRAVLRRLNNEYETWHAPNTLSHAVVTPIKVRNGTSTTQKRIVIKIISLLR